MRASPAIALLLTAGTLAAAAGRAQPAPAAARAKAALDSTVGAVYQRFLDGVRLRDSATYAAVLTPNYVHVAGDSATVRVGRAERVRRDLEMQDRIRLFQLRRCDVQRHGDAAVGPCWYREVVWSEGKEFDYVGVSLVTFVRGADGRWRIAATRPSMARDVPP